MHSGMTGRNDPCRCGSGKKYRLCCGRLGAAARSGPGPAEIGTLGTLFAAGRHVELEAQAREILVRWPSSGYGWQYLGIALAKQGKDPLQALERAAQCCPDDAGAHVNLGNALGRAGRLDEAAMSFGRALIIDAGCVEAHNNLSQVQLELGRADLAACSARRALELGPQFADAHNCLGNALVRSGRHEDAIASYRRALGIRPEFLDARINCASALRRVGRLEEAVQGFREALSARPDSVVILIELATALRLLGRTQECESACRRTFELEADSTAALMVLAELRADCGDFNGAQAMFKRVISLDPLAADAWAGLASLRRMTAADAPWLAQALNLAQQALPPQREAPLRFAIGKFYDDTEDFDNAFLHYRRANEIVREAGPPHDRALLARHIDMIIRSFDREWVGRRRVAVPRSGRAVFVVGTLRSGSSLTEQILSSHPGVFGAGELMFWAEKLGPAVVHANAEPTAKANIPDDDLTGWGLAYLELLNRLGCGRQRVIDKLPTNFLFLGPLYAALPEARFIHVQRHPIDTCLSIYFQRFEAANTYANDLEDLAHYYRQYLRLMRHWREILPAHTLLEVPYEALIRDPERWSRRMVEFLGLRWDPRCLEFQGTARSVRTASRWQVRQKISNRSVGRWRHYEKFVGPLRQLLQDSPGREKEDL